MDLTARVIAEIATAPTREQALEIALIYASGYAKNWRRDAECKLLPYLDGFDDFDAFVATARGWKAPVAAPAFAQAAE